jgi:hypothetical protein
MAYSIYFVDCEDKEVTLIQTDVKTSEIKEEIENLVNEEFDCFYDMWEIREHILEIGGTEKIVEKYIKSGDNLREQIDTLIKIMEKKKPKFAEGLRELKTELEDRVIEEVLEYKIILTNGSFYNVVAD